LDRSDEGAIQTLKVAVGLSAENLTLERAFLHAEARRAARASQWDVARDALQRLASVDPDEPWVYWDLAAACRALDDFEGAAIAYLTAADKHLARGETDQVLQAYQQAAAVSPNDPQIQAKLADPTQGAQSSAAAPPAAPPQQAPTALPDTKRGGARQSDRPAEQTPSRNGGDPPAPPATPSKPDKRTAPPETHKASATPPAHPAAQPPAASSKPTQKPAPPPMPPSPAPATPPAAREAPEPPPARAPRPRLGSKTETLGQVLQQLGVISAQQLNEALEIQARTGERIGQILRDMNVISDADLAKAMAHQWAYPYVALGERRLDADIVRLIPHALAMRHKCVAVERTGGRLLVAISDPLNVIAVDDVRLITGMEVDLAVATEEDITTALARGYQLSDTTIEKVLRDSLPDSVGDGGDEDVSVEQLKALVEEAPVVKLVNLVVDEAVKQGASDIHVEPQRNGVWVRFRVDGVLRDVMNPPKHLKSALVSRMKIMAEMDIAERRRPQDGRIHLVADGRNIDLRVSTLPTMYGEKVVMRILDQAQTMIGLTRLGFHSDTLRQWESSTSKPHGMVLVTGPTGSGKTTTLYATLTKLNTPELNIVTVEDPVEYQITRINQVQVNVKAGLTFATGLRHILRQDPDIVMVGEIRDKDTAEIAVQAALTGHLVLSTLHTNDAAGAVTRLIDMGVEPFLISSSVIGVLAQRLARAICSRCKVAYSPPPEALGRLGADVRLDSDVTFYRGQGCESCRGTGYRGRIGIFELMIISDTIRDMVVHSASSTEIKAQAIREGMRTLRDDGLEKVMSGVSTIDEILRVVYVQD
jgi:type IV pilus assembly protein PilB